MKLKRILLVEDSELMSDIIKGHFENIDYSYFEVAKDYDTAKAIFEKHLPELLICDVHLSSEQSGIDFVNDVLKNHPGIALIYISADLDEEVISQAQQTKPHAYLTKPFTREQLLTAVRMAMMQNKYNHPGNYQLTQREIDVLSCLSKGLSNHQTGEQLFISHHTVDSRRRKILEKLGVNTINEALCLATEKGWINVK